MKYAWIDPENVVREIAQGDPAEIYAPEVAANFDTEVDDDVEAGATRSGPKGKWVNPKAPEPPPVEEPKLPKLPPMQFYLAFSAQERATIKTNPDAIILEFWHTLELMIAKDVQVDPNLPSVQGGLAYLVDKKVLEKERVAEIRAGTPQ